VTGAVSLCFDDGFRRTAQKVLRIFGQRGLAASFAVLAAPELASDPAIRAAPIADWGFWRDAVAAGHTVEPHGYDHAHLGRMPADAAIASLERTLDCFAREIDGFRPADAVFHAPYLAAPPDIVEWIGARMLGVRIGGEAEGLNDLQRVRRGGRIQCVTYGPDGVDASVEARLDRFLAHRSGWLVLVLHGLDDEGWGPLSSSALEAVLDRLLAAGVAIEPPARVLLRVGADVSEAG